jgi:hypothetical protein
MNVKIIMTVIITMRAKPPEPPLASSLNLKRSKSIVFLKNLLRNFHILWLKKLLSGTKSHVET